MKSHKDRHANARDPRIPYLGLIAGLLVVAVLAASFTVVVVQLQSSVASYLGAHTIWSRGQAEAVRNLERYAETGDAEALARARRWHSVPLGFLQARKAIESDRMRYDEAYAGFMRGGVDERDIPHLIWSWYLTSEAPYIRQAAAAWRNTDAHILKLGAIADRLEQQWRSNPSSQQGMTRLRAELEGLTSELRAHSTRFGEVLTQANRSLTALLSFASVAFFTLLGVFTVLITLHLTRAIRNSERLFRTTFEQAAVGIAQGDKEGRFLEANQALCEILGHSREQLLGMRYPDLIHPEDQRIGREERVAAASGALNRYVVEQRLWRADGSTAWARITVSGFRTEHSRLRYIAIVEDISESYRLSAELSHQASHDELTGFFNRRAFERYLGDFLQRTQSEQSVHALCFIDLDQFRIINDTDGHVVGDYLLTQVAERLCQQLRRDDVLARLSGDEFGVILVGCEPQSAADVGAKLRAALVAEEFVYEGRGFSIDCSIGVVPITAASASTAELMRAADAACQLAKENGGGRVHFTGNRDRALSERREQMEWIGHIRAALEQGRFYMDAQRISSLTGSANLRYEVLVRMADEKGNPVSPGVFLPPAERFGMAHLIDRWVIEHVCATLSGNARHLAGLEACHINISGRSFDHVDFLDFVVGLFERYPVPPEKICFEITETAAVRYLSDVRAFMERLGALGCTFALDDFGSGVSSFGYLRQLPVELLKIDGAFVRNIATDDTDRAMVRAITDIGKTLGKTIVAEFVEDDPALEVLRELGVDYGQGFGIHYPSRLPAFIDLERVG